MLIPLSVPIIYSLELTALCNNHCPGCGNVFRRPTGQASEPPPHLSLDAWRKIIDKIAPHVHTLRLTGGEPTLHPQFQSIVQHLQQRDLHFTLFTNGCWPQATTLLDWLRRVPQCDALLISMHGADAQTHEAFSGTPGSFDRAIDGIRRAVAAGFNVSISTVFTRHNQAKLPQIVQLARSLGAVGVSFARFIGPDLPGISLSLAEVVKAAQTVDQLREAGEAVKFGSCVPYCSAPGNSSTGCYAGVAYCAVDPWGNLRPCTHSSLKAGNLLHSPIEVLWHSKVMAHFRRLAAAPCESCDAFAYCHGGCRAMIHELGQDPLINPAGQARAPELPTIHLNPNWHPTLNAKIYTQSWGAVLARGNRLLSVRAEAGPVLQSLDGQWTLREIVARHGPNSLELIGCLVHKRMLSLEQAEA